MQLKILQHYPIEYCPLCHHPGVPFYKNSFYECVNCGGIFRPEKHLPHPDKEKKRYEQHNNDVDDPDYRSFVKPLVTAVMQSYPPSADGLDYGAGTGPVISQMLEEAGYQTEKYDPFFLNKPGLLQRHYDYIVCCEVMEHFHNPDDEFTMLKQLLKPGGKLICKTDIYHEGIDFERWAYKNDLTHVFIYRKKTIWWIAENMHFSGVEIENRLIQFHKK